MFSFRWYEQSRHPMPDTTPTLRLGKWDVGFTGYDWTSAAKPGARHTAFVMLPGLKQHQGHYRTLEEAKTAVEEAVAYWFAQLDTFSASKLEVKPPQPVARRTRAAPTDTGETGPRRVRRGVPAPTQGPVGRRGRTR